MVKVLITADSKFPVNREKIRAAVVSVLREKMVASDVEVSVLICGTRKSGDLAKKYLNDGRPHDVLSFPLTDEASKRAFPAGRNTADFGGKHNGFLVLGDIVVCYPLAQEEANRDSLLVDTKIGELVTHGMLHLLGEHHEQG